MKSIALLLLAIVLGTSAAFPDEEPISGTIKAIDSAAHTLALETTAKGKTRQVTVDIRRHTKILRFVRPTEPGKGGFVEQEVTLGDLRPGWVVSVTAKHDGGREVADVVKIVLER